MFKIYALSACMLCSMFSVAQISHSLDYLLPPLHSQPGYALLIEKNGNIIYRKTDGLADLKTGQHLTAASDFRMASVSKQFTAMAILLLEKAHRLSFDQTIGRYLPELPENVGNRVSIRHLLTHSSGILDYETLIPAAQQKQVLDSDVLQLLKAKDSAYFVPGSQFRYSNSGYCLLPLIIERITHRSFSSFIKAYIFTPLKMNNSYVYEAGLHISKRAMGYAKDSSGNIVFSDQSITSATKGDGGIYTSLNDYMKWIHALQQNKLLNLSQVLKRIRFRINSQKGTYYGAGWFQTGLQQEVLFHSGNTCGFNNYVIEVPRNKLSVVCFSNLADNSGMFKEIVQVIKENGLGDFSAVFALYNLTD